MTCCKAPQSERLVSRATRSTVSMVVLPMPRTGVLTTRMRATESFGIQNELEVGDHVLDLGALVEAEASDDVVVQAVAAQSLFQQTRLRVGAIEDGALFSRPSRARSRAHRGDEVGGKERLVLAVGRVVETDLAAALARRPQILSLALKVVGDHGRSGLEDGLGGAVVLLEADDLGLGKILFEVEDVVDVGAAPGVDRLILIADGAEVVMGSGEGAHDLVLRTVGVLILIDEHVLEAALIFFARGGVGLEQADALQQQVVEVQSVGLEQLIFVNFVDVRDALHLGIGGVQIHLLRILHVVLGRGDEAETHCAG